MKHVADRNVSKSDNVTTPIARLADEPTAQNNVWQKILAA